MRIKLHKIKLFLNINKVKFLPIIIFFLRVSNVSAQDCTLKTGWQNYPYTAKVSIPINFGVSVEVSGGIFGEDVSIASKFRPCTQVDASQIYYLGKLYTSVTHPFLFEGYYPEIKWLSYVFNTKFTPTGRVFNISNPVCNNGNSNYISYINEAERKQLLSSNPNFKTSLSHFYHSDLRLTDLSMTGVSVIIEKLEKMLKGEDAYEKALNEYNSKQFVEALRTIDMAESLGYSTPKLLELKKKVEEALKNAKYESLKKQIDDLYRNAENKYNNKDYSGALSDIARGIDILDKEKINDTRFADLKKKIEMDKAQEAKEKEAKESNSTEKKTDSTSNVSESSSTSTSENSNNESSQNTSSEETISEEERKAEEARKAEQERLERQQEYYDKRNAQTSENYEAATEMSLLALMVHLTIGKFIYSHLDKPGNMVSSAGPTIEFHAGYSLSSTPLFVNITEESYDGNTYSYDEFSELRNALSLNLNAGLTFWHLKSKHFGLGYHAQLTGGHGLLFDNFLLGGVVGVKTYAGSKHLRAYSEYMAGFRDINYNNWLDAGKIVKGIAKTRFHQLKLGLRASNEIEWEGPTQLHFDFLPLFEVHKNTNYLPFGSNPIGWYWKQGIELGVKVDNRLSFIMQCVYEYPVIGKDLFGFKSVPKSQGTYFSFGVIRNLEFYGNHVKKQYVDENEIKSNATAKSFVELLCGSPKVEYLSAGRKLVNSRVAFHSVGIISASVNTGITNHLAVSWGGGISYRVMNFTVLEKANFTNGLTNSQTYLTDGLTANLPLGLKLHHHFNTNNKFWLLGGLEGRIGILNSSKMKSVLSPETDWQESNYKVNPSGLYQQFGFGANYTLGSLGFTSGLVFNRALKPFVKEDVSKVQNIEFRFGFIL